ncbi:UbiD family decarboxylase [Priestia aryabhattai]|uniref:UbiD family decarboxylase n=1 Tax=Priestia aryabhattai TaxID=412384 RepID=UPI0018765A12|nr:UbiD family decarboxylase [Priestia aryabhattai]MBE5098517.1 UbiD family decarboxylase [Priestia aryabhattai]
MKPLKSFREYVEVLEEYNEIVSINQEIDWDLEMSAIIRRAYDLPSPAPLFKNIKDSTPGFEVLGAPVGMSPNKEHPFIRVALSLGLPINTTAPELVEAWSHLPDVNPIPPRLVANGECKENKLFNDEIDLTKLPVPFIHVGDGGRYINTYGILIVRTPDGSWVNWSISRVMLDGPRTMAGVIIPSQDLGKIYRQWKEIDKEMPYALCLGVDPGIAMIAGYPLSGDANEGEMIGGWYGEPIEVVKCETSDLEVPATSEIVIEGTVSLEEMISEGPFGEYAGYTLVGHEKPVPRFNVTAMTHRNNPIMPVSVTGVPPEESSTNWGIAIAASIQNTLRKQGLPIKECFIPLESAVHWLVVTVDRSQQGDNNEQLAHEIGEAVFATRAGSYIPKVIVLDDDINPSNINQVVWALATRHRPDKREAMVDQKVLPLVGYLDEKEKREALTTKVIYNCLLPLNSRSKDEQTIEASFRSYPKKLRNHIIKNWERYGF